MIYNLRHRYIAFSLLALFFLIATTLHIRGYPSASAIRENLPEPLEKVVTPEPPPPAAPEPYPKYKPEPLIKVPPIVDNFPLAFAAHSAKDLPPIPSWNKPPAKHVDIDTTLFIGFTRNWRLLQQVVVSYVTAGWPPEDIYVVENTGVMNSNEKGLLSLQNPFFVNYTRLNMFGVNVIRTPTLLTFAQLQNFYTNFAIEKKWPTYFWSHMDVAAVPWEGRFEEKHPTLVSADADHTEFESLYHNAVQRLLEIKKLTGKEARWALRFFHYDHLALVNVQAFVEVGGWDTLIPFYMTDCDMHSRLSMADFEIKDADAGMIFDVASSLDDLVVLYRKKIPGVKASFVDPNIVLDKIIAAEEQAAEERKKKEEGKQKRDGSTTTSSTKPYWEGVTKWEEDSIHSEEFQHLVHTLDAMVESKGASKAGRNTWQARQRGGEGEPFYRDSAGFEKGIAMTIDLGRSVYSEKWGHRDCDIREKGLVASDAWRVEHDW